MKDETLYSTRARPKAILLTGTSTRYSVPVKSPQDHGKSDMEYGDNGVGFRIDRNGRQMYEKGGGGL